MGTPRKVLFPSSTTIHFIHTYQKLSSDSVDCLDVYAASMFFDRALDQMTYPTFQTTFN